MFYKQFYTGRSKISQKELANVKRKLVESIDDYLNRYRIMKLICFTQVPEHVLFKLGADGLYYSIRKKLDTKYLRGIA